MKSQQRKVNKYDRMSIEDYSELFIELVADNVEATARQSCPDVVEVQTEYEARIAFQAWEKALNRFNDFYPVLLYTRFAGMYYEPYFTKVRMQYYQRKKKIESEYVKALEKLDELSGTDEKAEEFLRGCGGTKIDPNFVDDYQANLLLRIIKKQPHRWDHRRFTGIAQSRIYVDGKPFIFSYKQLLKFRELKIQLEQNKKIKSKSKR